MHLLPIQEDLQFLKEKKVFLKFKDKAGTTKFVLREGDTKPVDADKLMLEDVQGQSEADTDESEPSKEVSQ